MQNRIWNCWGNGVSLYSGNLVDLESDLRGQTRIASDCPSTMFKPSVDKQLSQHLKNQPSCQMQYYPSMGGGVNEHFTDKQFRKTGKNNDIN